MVVCGLMLGGVFAGVAHAEEEVPVIEKLVATNCNAAHPGCGEEPVEGFFEPKASISETEAKNEGFTEAGGRVPYGVTDFKVLTVPGGKYSNGTVVPTLRVTHIRTDVAPGLATNPFATERCTLAEFGSETVPNSHLFTAPTGKCAEAEIGTNQVTAYGGAFGDLALEGEVYDLVPSESEKLENKAKLASLYGVALELPEALTSVLLAKGFEEAEEAGAKQGVGGFPTKVEQEFLEKKVWFAHTLIKGNVEWGKEARGTGQGDYHDYFEIEVSPELPLIRSRLVFEGTVGKGDFITNATRCTGGNTTSVKVRDLEGKESPPKPFKTPIELTGCKGLEFEPSFTFGQSSTVSDQPDSLTTEASLPYEPEERAQAQVKDASFALPAGMTLNPSAAYGLQACTPAEAHIETEQFGVSCPEASKLGTVSLNVPTLPDGSLTGDIYLGAPESGVITGNPYTMYVVADSAQYGVSVRLKAEVVANETTGQVTAYFTNTPEQPFKSIKLQFDRGMLTSVANPLICGTPKGSVNFKPTDAGETAEANLAFGAEVTGCAASIPFSLSQSSENETGNGGGHTSWTYGLTRPEGNQYLQTVKTTLPPGLVGNIPAVTLCGEPQAAQGTCTNASKIGTVSVAAGSGNSPYVFNGSVYMTGPYNGAPFGLSIVVPAVAGPFNLGNVVSRATISVNPSTAQVTSVATLPTIVKGIPVRLRSLTVNVNKQGFLDNPTNCSQLNVESELISTEGMPQTGLKTPFQVANCGSLAFSPKFSAATSAKTSRANGASLTTTLTATAGQANIKSVKVQLPRQLPSRLSTLNKACTEAQFNANPLGCPAASKVGTATVITPTLGKPMTGPAIFVSHGGEAFPDLDLVVEGEGVRVILVGNTNIKNNITTTTFASTPDVPVTSVTVSLPAKSNSALAAYGDICRYPLTMPTTITGQNGKEVKSTTKIAVSGCGVKVIGHKVIGNTAYLTVKTFAAGRVSGTGNGVSKASRSFSGAQNAATLKVPLSSSGKARRKPLKVKIRVGFVPRKGAHSITYVTVTYR
jgi:hypothetical protein